MKEITVEEQREILVEMLSYIDKICRENNINYFLWGGTLLGAARHKGFIPWDDDVDIGIPFQDYKKFIKVMKEDGKYNVNNPYDNEDYYYFFTKITDKKTFLKERNFRKIDTMGIFIDVFPLFNLPNSEEERINMTNNFRELEKKYFRFYGFEKYYYDKKLSRKIIKAIVFFPQLLFKSKIKKIRDRILNAMEESIEQETDYIGFIIPPSTLKGALPKEIFKDKTEIEFEGHKLYAPNEYKKYLELIYGDYMKFPPIEERVSPHNFDAVWR